MKVCGVEFRSRRLLPRHSGMSSCATGNDDFAVYSQMGGAVLALLGIVATVAGLLGLKIHGNTGRIRECTKNIRWYAAIAGWCIGQLLQLLAVRLASEPVVAAVTTLAVPVNALLAWRYLGERITQWDWVSIVIMLLGAGLVVFSSPQYSKQGLSVSEEGALFTSPTGVVMLGATGVVSCVAGFAVMRGRRHGGTSAGLGFGLFAGVSGALSITTAKLCWLLLYDSTHGGENLFTQAPTYVFGFTSFIGEVGMAVAVYLGLRSGEATVVVPAYYISMTVLASLQGLLLFDQIGCFSPAGGSAFGIGVLLACGAVVLMAGVRKPNACLGTELGSSPREAPLMADVPAASDAPVSGTASSGPPGGFMG